MRNWASFLQNKQLCNGFHFLTLCSMYIPPITIRTSYPWAKLANAKVKTKLKADKNFMTEPRQRKQLADLPEWDFFRNKKADFFLSFIQAFIQMKLRNISHEQQASDIIFSFCSTRFRYFFRGKDEECNRRKSCFFSSYRGIQKFLAEWIFF